MVESSTSIIQIIVGVVCSIVLAILARVVNILIDRIRVFQTEVKELNRLQAQQINNLSYEVKSLSRTGSVRGSVINEGRGSGSSGEEIKH